MDYKKIIKSRAVREGIIRMFSFMPDKQMIQFQYWIKMGRKLDLSFPKRFTEKLQWYKLYYRDPLMACCVDKHDVREYVQNCGLANILNKEIGVFEHPEQIDYSVLPDAFVIKDTLGSGGNSVIIVHDKGSINKMELYARMVKWVNIPVKSKHPGREWVYGSKTHRIQIEQFIPSDDGLVDWKFFCFNGRAEYMYVIADRDLGMGASLGIYDREFTRLPYHRTDERKLEKDIIMPSNFVEMRTIAEKLAAPFPEVRIDLYNQYGRIIFGEITFFDGSGYMKFDPDEFDFIIGEKFILPAK